MVNALRHPGIRVFLIGILSAIFVFLVYHPTTPLEGMNTLMAGFFGGLFFGMALVLVSHR